MSSLRMFGSMFLLFLPLISCSAFTSEGTCSAQQQRSILAAVMGCQIRDTFVDLREYLPDSSNLLQMIPDLATVKRCGGSCDLYAHSCVPKATKKRRIEVMLVQSSSSSLQPSTECGQIEVEEHESCECACPIQADHCQKSQYYEKSSCRCICKDRRERAKCLQKGMQWDETRCLCMCPKGSWQSCSSGYVFDFAHSCECVATGTTASTGLFAAVAILTVCFGLTAIGVYFMHKRQLGLFRPDKQTILREQQRSNPHINAHSLLEEPKKRANLEVLREEREEQMQQLV